MTGANLAELGGMSHDVVSDYLTHSLCGRTYPRMRT